MIYVDKLSVRMEGRKRGCTPLRSDVLEDVFIFLGNRITVCPIFVVGS